MRYRTKQLIDLYLGGGSLLLLRPLARALGALGRRDHALDLRGGLTFIKMMGGGSLLIALPALLGLRRRHPRIPFTLVCGRSIVPFARLTGVFDKIESIDDDRGIFALLRSSIGVLLSQWRHGTDTVIDLEVYSRLTSVLSLATLARNRIGFYVSDAYWRRSLHSHLVFFNRNAGVYKFYDAIARMLGAKPAGMSACRRHLSVLVRRECDGGEPPRGALAAGGPFIAVGAGCSDLAAERRLPKEEWGRLAKKMRPQTAGLPWVFLGGADDREVCESAAAAVAKALGPRRFRYENLCGKLSFAGSLSVLRRARRFVGVDSALLHAARLLGVPTVSSWGPTSPETLLRPIKDLKETVFYKSLICSPCIHVAETPPCQGDNVCMRHFSGTGSPQRVWFEDSAFTSGFVDE